MCGVLGVSAFHNAHREHSSFSEMGIRSSQYNRSLSLSIAVQAAASYCDSLAERDQILNVQSLWHLIRSSKLPISHATQVAFRRKWGIFWMKTALGTMPRQLMQCIALCIPLPGLQTTVRPFGWMVLRTCRRSLPWPRSGWTATAEIDMAAHIAQTRAMLKFLPCLKLLFLLYVVSTCFSQDDMRGIGVLPQPWLA